MQTFHYMQACSGYSVTRPTVAGAAKSCGRAKQAQQKHAPIVMHSHKFSPPYRSIDCYKNSSSRSSIPGKQRTEHGARDDLHHCRNSLFILPPFDRHKYCYESISDCAPAHGAVRRRAYRGTINVWLRIRRGECLYHTKLGRFGLFGDSGGEY